MQKNPSRISAQGLFVFSRWIFSNFLLLSTMQQHLEVCIKKRSSKKQKYMENYLMEKCLLRLACRCCLALPSVDVEHFKPKAAFIARLAVK